MTTVFILPLAALNFVLADPVGPSTSQYYQSGHTSPVHGGEKRKDSFSNIQFALPIRLIHVGYLGGLVYRLAVSS